jgi:LacI family transcriptional regulator, asc operon repressor
MPNELRKVIGAQVSIVDVAAAAGVSKSAASRALLGQSGVTDGVRAHVAEVAVSLGYVKDYRAYALKSADVRTIAIYVRSVQLSFYGELIAEIQKMLELKEYRLAIMTGGRDARNVWDSVMSFRPSGVIIASGRVDLGRLEASATVPVVLAGPRTESTKLSSVSDDGRGIVALVELALESGHHHIGVLDVPRHRSTTLGDRSALMRRELIARGIEPVMIPAADWGDEPDPEALRAVVNRVTTIMCPNDPSLVRTWELLDSWGISVPGDVSLTGYDGLGHLASPVLGLTTWRQPVSEIGRVAVEEVITRISDQSAQVRHIELRGSLLRGRSLTAR